MDLQQSINILQAEISKEINPILSCAHPSLLFSQTRSLFNKGIAKTAINYCSGFVSLELQTICDEHSIFCCAPKNSYFCLAITFNKGIAKMAISRQLMISLDLQVQQCRQSMISMQQSVATKNLLSYSLFFSQTRPLSSGQFISKRGQSHGNHLLL